MDIEHPPRHCCHLDCGLPADYEVCDVGGDPYAGTDACAEHLGALVVGPANVYPLPPSAQVH